MAKYAYSQWSWGMGSSDDFVTACRELSAAGCYGIEGVAAFADLFGGYEHYAAACRNYGMTTAGVYFFLTGDFQKDIEELLNKIDYVAATGVKTVTVQAPFGVAKPTEEQIDTVIRTVAAYGKILRPYGIMPCVHPHHNTAILRECEIDALMERTNPDEVGLCPDTAHLVAGGCDPVAIFEKYASRIRFVHLKDIVTEGMAEDPTRDSSVYARFRELGEGVIDFPAIFSVLKKAGYDGWLCVELDGSRTTNFDSACKSMKYLDENW